MRSNHAIEKALSDEGGIVRFNLSAYPDSIGFNFCAQPLLVAFLDNFISFYILMVVGAGVRCFGL